MFEEFFMFIGQVPIPTRDGLPSTWCLSLSQSLSRRILPKYPETGHDVLLLHLYLVFVIVHLFHLTWRYSSFANETSLNKRRLDHSAYISTTVTLGANRAPSHSLHTNVGIASKIGHDSFLPHLYYQPLYHSQPIKKVKVPCNRPKGPGGRGEEV
jgi:hypothetical protein